MFFCLFKSRNVMSWLEAKDNEWFEYFIYSGSVTLCLMFTYCSFLLNSVFIRHVYLGFLLSILGSDGGKQKHWCCSTRDSGGRDGQTKAGDPAVQRLYSNTAAAPAGTGELALRLCGFKSWNLHTHREKVSLIFIGVEWKENTFTKNRIRDVCYFSRYSGMNTWLTVVCVLVETHFVL